MENIKYCSGNDYFDKFDPNIYLRRHAHIDKSQHMLRCFHDAFQTIPKGISVLDYSSGPSVRGTISAATKASEIVLSDYSASNFQLAKEIGLKINHTRSTGILILVLSWKISKEETTIQCCRGKKVFGVSSKGSPNAMLLKFHPLKRNTTSCTMLWYLHTCSSLLQLATRVCSFNVSNNKSCKTRGIFSSLRCRRPPTSLYRRWPHFFHLSRSVLCNRECSGTMWIFNFIYR